MTQKPIEGETQQKSLAAENHRAAVSRGDPVTAQSSKATTFVFTTAEAMEPERMKVALDHITDVAKVIDARYWLTSRDDFHLESPVVWQMAISRENEVLRDLPVVFSSADDRVRSYALGNMTRPESVRPDDIKGTNP